MPWLYPLCIGAPLLLLNFGLFGWYLGKRAQKYLEDAGEADVQPSSEKDYSAYMHKIVAVEKDDNFDIENFSQSISETSFERSQSISILSDTSQDFEQSFPSDTSYGTNLTSPAFESPKRMLSSRNDQSPTSELALRSEETETTCDLISPQEECSLSCKDADEIDDLKLYPSDFDPARECFERNGMMHQNRANRLTWPFRMKERKESFDRYLEYNKDGDNFNMRLVE